MRALRTQYHRHKLLHYQKNLITSLPGATGLAALVIVISRVPALRHTLILKFMHKLLIMT
jgi:hypothetical protein